jgi:hypothetical protein
MISVSPCALGAVQQSATESMTPAALTSRCRHVKWMFHMEHLLRQDHPAASLWAPPAWAMLVQGASARQRHCCSADGRPLSLIMWLARASPAGLSGTSVRSIEQPLCVQCLAVMQALSTSSSALQGPALEDTATGFVSVRSSCGRTLLRCVSHMRMHPRVSGPAVPVHCATSCATMRCY